MKPIVAEWVAKAEGDFASLGREIRARKQRNPDAACFHAQQGAEKYLKARLCQAGLDFPRVHDLTALLDLTLAVEPAWEIYRRDLAFLSDFAVSFRYPGECADGPTAGEAAVLCR